MKKHLFLSLVLVIISFVTLVAQSKENAALPVKTGNEWQMPKDVLVRSHAFAHRCQELLHLDSTTTDKFFSLYLNNTKPVDEIRVSGKTEHEKKEAFTANQREFDEKVRQLVTTEQYEMYVKDRKTGKLANFFVRIGI